MNGLLRRLAGQAVGPKANGQPQIRAAATIHAAPPVSSPLPPEPQGQSFQRALSLRDAVPAQRDSSWAAEGAATTSNTPHLREGGRLEITASDVARTGNTEMARAAAAALQTPPVAPPSARVEPVGLPTRLFDETSTPAPMASAIMPPSFQTGQIGHDTRAASGEPGEVHVHIGRIEVTAVVEPDKPKRNSPPPRRQTRPLADYLARGRN